MVLTLTDNCDLDVTVKPSGIPGILTLDIKRQFPQAQTPRWQPLIQVNATPCQLWELGSHIMQESKPHK